MFTQRVHGYVCISFFFGNTLLSSFLIIKHANFFIAKTFSRLIKIIERIIKIYDVK